MSENQEPQDNGAWEVRRHIPLIDSAGPAQAQRIAEALEQTPGVREVAVDHRKPQVVVRYDPRSLFYSELIGQLSELGHPPKNSRWQRFKAGWYEFTDQNARDNAIAPPPACCNKSPK